MTGIMKDEDKNRNIYTIMEVKKSNFYNETYTERTITEQNQHKSYVDRRAWQATAHEVSKNWTQLNDFHFKKIEDTHL